MIKILPFNSADIPTLISWVDSPESTLDWAHYTFPYPLGREKVEAHLFKANYLPVTLKVYKISKDGETVGHIEIDEINSTEKTARISRLFIAPSFRKKGIAQSAINEALKVCFNELNLNHVEIYVFTYNEPAYKLYEKIGFRKKSIMKNDITVNGKSVDSIVMGISKYDRH